MAGLPAGRVGYWRPEDVELVIREATDVANFALMVADIARRNVPLRDQAP